MARRQGGREGLAARSQAARLGQGRAPRAPLSPTACLGPSRPPPRPVAGPAAAPRGGGAGRLEAQGQAADGRHQPRRWGVQAEATPQRTRGCPSWTPPTTTPKTEWPTNQTWMGHGPRPPCTCSGSRTPAHVCCPRLHPRHRHPQDGWCEPGTHGSWVVGVQAGELACRPVGRAGPQQHGASQLDPTRPHATHHHPKTEGPRTTPPLHAPRHHRHTCHKPGTHADRYGRWVRPT
jgi:hypothetical protein